VPQVWLLDWAHRAHVHDYGIGVISMIPIAFICFYLGHDSARKQERDERGQ
jgi:hypothetical protein